MAVTLKLRPGGLETLKLAAQIKSDKQLADRFGIDAGQLSRVVSGKSSPGPRFIAGAINEFGPKSFDILFVVVPVDGSAESSAA